MTKVVHKTVELRTTQYDILLTSQAWASYRVRLGGQQQFLPPYSTRVLRSKRWLRGCIKTWTSNGAPHGPYQYLQLSFFPPRCLDEPYGVFA